jgi:hypothetical protein
VNDSLPRVLDGLNVAGILTTLEPTSRISGDPARLAENEDTAFLGQKVLGLGFAVSPQLAQDLIVANPQNKDVLYPYLNGRDLNSSPTLSAGRWIIDFQDWPEERASKYTECFDRARRLVRPERLSNKIRSRRELWWQFAEPGVGLRKAIRGLDRVIVMAQVSKTAAPVFVRNENVYDQKLIIFASNDAATLSILSSSPHYWWAIIYSGKMRVDLSYSPKEVFLTFPRPAVNQTLRDLGEALDVWRLEVMSSRSEGLTSIYNLVHDPTCVAPEIARLRAIHERIDAEVLLAYGWQDLVDRGLDIGHHDTRQGVRFTIGPTVQREVLDRLLELNHRRHAEEVVAGLHDRDRRGAAGKSGDATRDALFDM